MSSAGSIEPAGLQSRSVRVFNDKDYQKMIEFRNTKLWEEAVIFKWNFTYAQPTYIYDAPNMHQNPKNLVITAHKHSPMLSLNFEYELFFYGFITPDKSDYNCCRKYSKRSRTTDYKYSLGANTIEILDNQSNSVISVLKFSSTDFEQITSWEDMKMNFIQIQKQSTGALVPTHVDSTWLRM